MKCTRLLPAAAFLAIFGAFQATAAMVTFSMTRHIPSPPFECFCVPGQVHKFFATTNADILSVNQVQVQVAGGGLFQIAPPFGSNIEPPDPAFVGLNETLNWDSWVTTPGPTVLLGADLPGDGTGTWGDLSSDGPQTNFHFARLTIPQGTTGLFTGRISVAGAAGPEVFPFSFPLGIPEPAGLAPMSLGLISLAAIKLRMSCTVSPSSGRQPV